MAYNIAANMRIATPDPIGVDQLKRRNALVDMQMAQDQQRNALYGQQIEQNAMRMSADQQAQALEQVRQWAPGAIAQVRSDPKRIPAFVAAGQQLGVIDPSRDPATVTADEIEEFATALGVAPPQAAVPFEQTPDGMRLAEQRRQFDERMKLDRAKFAAEQRGGGASREVNKQLVTRPLPDGRQQDFAFNPQTSQLEPVGQPYEKAAPLSPKDTGVVKQKLIQINTARQQLEAAKRKFAAIQNSVSAGPGGQFVPTPAGKAFDAAIDAMRGTITSITRVPGVGAMSDYETRLDQAKFPERGNYEAVTAQKLEQLDALISGLDAGYRDLLGGPSDTAAPAAPAAPAQQPKSAPKRIRVDAQGNVIGN